MKRFLGLGEIADTNQFTHGAVYHALCDRPLAEARSLVVDLVPKSSSVLDIACGTGELCFALASQKNCRVVGLDLSHRMIEFARKRNRLDNVCFIRQDATDLTGLEPCEFDYATILFLLHQVPRDEQVKVVCEAMRIAHNVIVVDSKVPLPRNLHGIALRIAEALAGPQHYRRFADYLAAGGIEGILGDSRVRASVARRCVFWHRCREMIMLIGQAKEVS
jgi:SAM-dependent methyltransferase